MGGGGQGGAGYSGESRATREQGRSSGEQWEVQGRSGEPWRSEEPERSWEQVSGEPERSWEQVSGEQGRTVGQARAKVQGREEQEQVRAAYVGGGVVGGGGGQGGAGCSGGSRAERE